jgi:hypothetical protein
VLKKFAVLLVALGHEVSAPHRERVYRVNYVNKDRKLIDLGEL